MRIRCGIAAIILGLSAMAACAQEEVKVTGRVVDSAGEPVAGAELATFWIAEGTERMRPLKSASTNADGRFALSMTFYGRGETLLALDKERKTGGLIVVEPKEAAKPLKIKLAPLVRVHGQFFCKDLNRRPEWTNVYMKASAMPILQCSSDKATFSFLLPPGKYKFWGYGTDIQDLKKDITLNAGEPDLDLKSIDMPATIIARHKGKAPPAWHVTDARGVKKDVKIADFKGKWVLLEFWGYW